MPASRSVWAFGVAVACSLALMGLPQDNKHVVASFCRARLLATAQWTFSQVIRYARNEQKTRFLLTENVQLALDNMHLREAARENARLRDALAFRSGNRELELVAAEVIGRDPDQLYDAIVVNAGSRRGVAANWPVVTAAGLVGYVSEVGVSSSLVQLLMRSPVSALVQNGRAQCMVYWVSGNRFRLRFLESSSQVEEGDRVISSGLGGRYPKGIPIGVLTEVRSQGRDPLFHEVYLESYVDFLRLEEVFIVRPDAAGTPSPPARTPAGAVPDARDS